MMTDRLSPNRFFYRAIFLAAFTACVSCGGSEAPPAQTESAKPAAGTASAPTGTCALLTAGEIQEVLGKAAGAPQPLEGTEVCTWPSAEDPSTTLLRLTFTDSGYPSYEGFVSSYQAEFGGEEPPKQYFRPIEGVGDWAMYVADENALQVYKGGRMLQVGTVPPDEQQAIALAKKAVPRLP
jgi:hypothetical protein